MDKVRSLIIDVPDFPKEGIVFKDITPVLRDAAAFDSVVGAFYDRYKDAGITAIAGIESRGFIFGAPIALRLGCAFVPVRKPGKLPRPTHHASYALEYGEDAVHVHRDDLDDSDRVVIIDDLLATGGTAAATAEVIRKCGAKVHEIGVVIELSFLKGRNKLPNDSIHSLLTY